MKYFVIVLASLFIGISPVFNQSLSGKKILKTANKLEQSGDLRSAVTVLNQNRENAGKFQDEVYLQLGILQGRILLLDSAILSLNEASKSVKSSISDKSKSEMSKVGELKSKYNLNVAQGKRFAQDQKYQKATNFFIEAFTYDTGNYEAWFNLAEVSERNQSVDESLRLFEKATTKYVNSPIELAHIFEHISESHLIKREYKNAVSAAEKAMVLDTLALEPYLLKAKALFNLHAYDSAQLSLTVYLDQINTNKLAWTLRGDCYFFLGRYSSAISDYSSAIYLDDKLTEAINYRGQSYFYTKQYALAKLDFKTLDEIFDGNYYAKNAIGICAYAEDQYPVAVAQFEEVSKLSTQDQYIFNLAMAYYRNKQYKKALPLFDQLAMNHRLEPKYNVAKAWVLVELKKYRDAENWMDDAIRENGYIQEYFAVRAIIYRKLGETKKALKDERIAHAIKGEPLSFDLNF